MVDIDFDIHQRKTRMSIRINTIYINLHRFCKRSRCWVGILDHSLEGSGTFLYNLPQQFWARCRILGCNLLNIVLIHLKGVE